MPDDNQTPRPKDQDIISLHRELQHINAKDGTFTDSEKKRIDVLQQILHAEPNLKNILVPLDIRQRNEINALVDKQRREPSPAFANQYAQMEGRHEQERERHIREFYKAQEIKKELHSREEQKGLDLGHDLDE